MAETLSSRRSHGHVVRWFDERLGESPAWAQYTKNTFIDIDPDEDEPEDKSAYRRLRSAPARAHGLKATSRMSPDEHDEMVEAARIAVAATSSWEHTIVWCNGERSTRLSHRGCRSRGPSTGCSSRSGRSSGRSSRRSSQCPKSKRRQSKRSTACPIVLTGCNKAGRPGSRRNSGISSGRSSGPSSRRSSVIGSAPGSRRNSGTNSVASSRPGSRHRMKKLTSGKASKKFSSKCAWKNEVAERESEVRSAQHTEAESESSESEQSEEEPVARKRRERMSAVVWTRLNERPQPEVKVSNRFSALDIDNCMGAPKAATLDVSVDMELDEAEQDDCIPIVPVAALTEVVLAREDPADADHEVDMSQEQPLQCEHNAENTTSATEHGVREALHPACIKGDCATIAENLITQDDTAKSVRDGEASIGTTEEPAQVSKHAKKRAQKKMRKVAQAASEASQQADDAVQLDKEVETCDAHAEGGHASGSQAELSQKQSQMLAQLAVRLNEQHIAMHLRSLSVRRLLLATPVNPLTRTCEEMLDVEPGDVIHCEMTDSSGWGYGVVVAPLRLSGKRGCFKCDFMSPIVVEVRSNRGGDTLEFTPGKWSEVAGPQNVNTKNRLREKAAFNRIRAAQRAWEKKNGKE